MRGMMSFTIWALFVALVLSQQLFASVASTGFEDQKTYYTPPISHGTPPTQGGSYTPTPTPTPTDPSSPPNCGFPPYVDPSPPSHTPTPSHPSTPKTPSHPSTPKTPSHPSTPKTPSHPSTPKTPSHSPPCNCDPKTPSTPKTPKTPKTPSHPSPSNPPSGGYYSPPSTPIVVTPPSGGYYSPPSTPIVVTPPSGGYYSPPSTPIVVTPPTPIDPGTPIIGGSPPIIGGSPPVDPGTPGTPFLPAPFPPITGTCDYWRNHPTLIWGLLGWWGTVGGAFGTVSVPNSIPGFDPHMNLLQALSNPRTDAIGALYREGTASWLNSMVNHRFPFTTPQVRDHFVAGLSSTKAATKQAHTFKLANEGRLKPRD